MRTRCRRGTVEGGGSRLGPISDQTRKRGGESNGDQDSGCGRVRLYPRCPIPGREQVTFPHEREMGARRSMPVPAPPTYPRYAIASEAGAVSLPLREAEPLATSRPATVTVALDHRRSATPTFEHGERCGYTAGVWVLLSHDRVTLRTQRDGHVRAGALVDRLPSPEEWSEAVRGCLSNALLTSRDGERFLTRHAPAVAPGPDGDRLLLVGSSYAGKSSVPAAIHEMGT